MTDERLKALAAIRELKNSGMSRLEQAIQVRKKQYNIKYNNLQKGEINNKIEIEDDYHQNDSVGFVVDEEGNSVRYEDEEEIQKVQVPGVITHFIKNMEQGQRVAQSTKVDKNLVRAKEKKLDELMNEIGDDEDDEVNKKSNNKITNLNNNKMDFNFEIAPDFVPEYSKRKVEDNNIDNLDTNNDVNLDKENNDNDINIETSSPKGKQRIIRR